MADNLTQLEEDLDEMMLHLLGFSVIVSFGVDGYDDVFCRQMGSDIKFRQAFWCWVRIIDSKIKKANESLSDLVDVVRPEMPVEFPRIAPSYCESAISFASDVWSTSAHLDEERFPIDDGDLSSWVAGVWAADAIKQVGDMDFIDRVKSFYKIELTQARRATETAAGTQQPPVSGLPDDKTASDTSYWHDEGTVRPIKFQFGPVRDTKQNLAIRTGRGKFAKCLIAPLRANVFWGEKIAGKVECNLWFLNEDEFMKCRDNPVKPQRRKARTSANKR